MADTPLVTPVVPTPAPVIVAPAKSPWNLERVLLLAGAILVGQLSGLIHIPALDKYVPGPSAAVAAVDPLSQVKAAATAYRQDEAAAFRRVKARLARTGDLAKDKVALAQSIHDERIAKAQALADSLTSSPDWSAALDAAASVFDKTK